MTCTKVLHKVACKKGGALSKEISHLRLFATCPEQILLCVASSNVWNAESVVSKELQRLQVSAE